MKIVIWYFQKREALSLVAFIFLKLAFLNFSANLFIDMSRCLYFTSWSFVNWEKERNFHHFRTIFNLLWHQKVFFDCFSLFWLENPKMSSNMNFHIVHRAQSCTMKQWYSMRTSYFGAMKVKSHRFDCNQPNVNLRVCVSGV